MSLTLLFYPEDGGNAFLRIVPQLLRESTEKFFMKKPSDRLTVFFTRARSKNYSASQNYVNINRLFFSCR
jgi:hypothetical protein